jgi:ABC-type nitrate/sulfonate/bicarbonate transport system substrate-binding protein
MTTVHLGFKAFDLHELACHFIARHTGIYSAHGLDVRLLDTSFIPDDQLPPRMFQVACGAALISWLQGARTKVVFVACDRPMFWLIARPEITAPEQLAGRSIAGFPPGSPPAQLLRLILRARGLSGDGGPTVVAARDDTARLGLLTGGDVQAAVVSSAVLPGRIRRRGLSVVQFFGVALRLPTTGLAVRESLLLAEPALAQVMCRCFRESLQMLRLNDDLVRAALGEFLECSGAESGEAVELLRGCYTADGRSTGSIQAQAIESMRWALGNGTALPDRDLYDYAALERDTDESHTEAG